MAPHRFLLRQAVSIWCWTFLVASTCVWAAIGQVRAVRHGPRESFGDAVRTWAGGIMRWGFHRCEVRASADVPSPAVVLVNHQSGFDVALIAWLLPPPLFFVARLEVGRIPLIGSVLRRGGHVVVRRGAGLANDAALDEAAARLRQGGRVVIFGEGTRSRRDEVLPLRSGAFRLAARAGVPLVPLVLAGTRATLPASAWPIVPSRVSAEFLPPRSVAEADARSPAFRESVRRDMEATLVRLAAGTGRRI